MEYALNTRLIAFGDSWTAGHGIENDSRYTIDAEPPRFISKLREQNSWPRWVSNKLNIQVVNLGVCGWGNEWIYNEIKNSIDNKFIKKSDTIIVVFSYPYRYSNKNKYTPIEILKKTHNLLKPYNHYFFNGFYPLLKDEEIGDYVVPNTFIEPTKTLGDVLLEYEKNNNISVWEENKRCVYKDVQNYNEGIFHPNLLGYSIIGKYIYSKINA